MSSSSYRFRYRAGSPSAASKQGLRRWEAAHHSSSYCRSPFQCDFGKVCITSWNSLELESCWEWISGVKHVLTDTGYPRASGNQRNDRVIVADFGFLN